MPFMLAFLEQHSLALAILMTVTAAFSWWVTRKKLAVRNGLDIRFVGRALTIAATAMALLSRAPLPLRVAVFVLGLALSILGGMKFGTARQSRPERQLLQRLKLFRPVPQWTITPFPRSRGRETPPLRQDSLVAFPEWRWR